MNFLKSHYKITVLLFFLLSCSSLLFSQGRVELNHLSVKDTFHIHDPVIQFKILNQEEFAIISPLKNEIRLIHSSLGSRYIKGETSTRNNRFSGVPIDIEYANEKYYILKSTPSSLEILDARLNFIGNRNLKSDSKTIPLFFHNDFVKSKIFQGRFHFSKSLGSSKKEVLLIKSHADEPLVYSYDLKLNTLEPLILRKDLGWSLKHQSENYINFYFGKTHIVIGNSKDEILLFDYDGIMQNRLDILEEFDISEMQISKVFLDGELISFLVDQNKRKTLYSISLRTSVITTLDLSRETRILDLRNELIALMFDGDDFISLAEYRLP